VSDGSAHAAALEHLRRGEPAAAEAVLRDAPDGVDVLHLRAVAAHQLRRPSQAEAFLAHALQLADSPSTVASLHNDLGNIRLESGDPSGAVTAYEASLTAQPGDAPTLANLATALRLCGQAARSAEAGLQALTLDPTSSTARHAVWTAVQRLAAEDDADAALAVMRRWHELDPQHSGVRHRLAALGGLPDPGQAPPDYVESLFDAVAEEFDPHLASLGYRAPELVAGSVRAALGAPAGDRVVADVGCGTGLAGVLVRPWAVTLVGCDLSLGMLGRAQRRGCYDELFKADLVDFLVAQPGAFDLVVCADTLCYLGGLSAFASASAGGLRPGGVVVATVEELPAGAVRPDWALSPTGRYQHSEEHVRAACAAAGLSDVDIRRDVLRHEGGVPVPGLVWTARGPR
jgi:predicted TPR repeat methyltransferase